MLLLDITIVSVALPSIQRDLRASLPDLQWVSAAYALVLAVLLLLAATLGDRLGLVLAVPGPARPSSPPGRWRVRWPGPRWRWSCSARCREWAGAVLFATGTPLLRAEFSGAALARALGVFGATLGGASAIGPLAGGVLTDTLGWRSTSLSTCPSAWRRSRAGWPGCASPATRPAVAPTWVGTAPTTAATASMVALIRGNAAGWASPAIVALLAAAAIALAGFVMDELRVAAAPMADLRLFAGSPRPGSWCSAISATVIGMIIYLSLYMNNTLGYSPVQAGLRFLPLSPDSFTVAC